MRQSMLLAIVAVTAGCQATPQKAVMPPLPEDTPAMTFAELATRARHQAMAALEAYYVDRWADVEESAKGLEQTARFLKRATAVPASRQGDLSLRAETLAEAANKLRAAAQAHSVDEVNSILQKINSQVRELR